MSSTSQSDLSLAEMAAQLASARADKQLIDSTPFESIASATDGYAVQSMAIDKYDSAQTGYKVGATNEAVQKMFGADSPFFGPIFEREHLQPDTKFDLAPGLLGGEAEFAFLCGDDFPTDREITVEDLPDLVQSCHIAVELVGRRTLGDGLPSFNSAVADFGANVAFMAGPAVPNWKNTDLAKVKVTANTNGEQTNAGVGSAVLGHPLNSLLWLHNALKKQGKGLRKGEWVSTGTCLGVIKAEANSTIEITFEGCGKIGYQIGALTG